MNEIEESAKNDGYLGKFLPAYEELHGIIERKMDQPQTVQDVRLYWSVFSKIQYFTFETLYSLFNVIKTNPSPPKPPAEFTNLPVFMGRYLATVSTDDYLGTMMALLEASPKLDRKSFSETIVNIKWSQRKKAKCWWRWEKSDKEKLIDKFKHEYSAKHKELLVLLGKAKTHRKLRNYFVHGFRPPWWYRSDDQKLFGFPEASLRKRKMDDELWKAIQDVKKWEHDIEKLPKKDFVSSQQLLMEVHDCRAKTLDLILRIALSKIKPIS